MTQTQKTIINEIKLLLDQINDPAVNHYVQDAKDACTQITVPFFRHNKSGRTTKAFALSQRILGSWFFITDKLPVGQTHNTLKTVDKLGTLAADLYNSVY